MKTKLHKKVKDYILKKLPQSFGSVSTMIYCDFFVAPIMT